MSTRKIAVSFACLGFLSGYVPTVVAADLACNDSGVRLEHVAATTHGSRFNIVGPDVVEDKQTGLMWERCPYHTTFDPIDEQCKQAAPQVSAFLSWPEALGVVSDTTVYRGYTGWRLPNIKELLSIVERSCGFPALNEAVFLSFGATHNYWSNTPILGASPAVLQLNFGAGTIASAGSPAESYALLRLVRENN